MRGILLFLPVPSLSEDPARAPAGRAKPEHRLAYAEQLVRNEPGGHLEGTVDTCDPDQLAEDLRELRIQRRRGQAKSRGGRPRRNALARVERQKVLAATAGRCHICGGLIEGPWQADHVLAHSAGGLHAADNYLPAHTLCNNYRWDYLPDEFQLILKLGVWARTQVANRTAVGRAIAEGFAAHERRRRSRLGTRSEDST